MDDPFNPQSAPPYNPNQPAWQQPAQSVDGAAMQQQAQQQKKQPIPPDAAPFIAQGLIAWQKAKVQQQPGGAPQGAMAPQQAPQQGGQMGGPVPQQAPQRPPAQMGGPVPQQAPQRPPAQMGGMGAGGGQMTPANPYGTSAPAGLPQASQSSPVQYNVFAPQAAPRPTSAADAGAFLLDAGFKDMDPAFKMLVPAIAAHMDDFNAKVYQYKQDLGQQMADLGQMNARTQEYHAKAEEARQRALVLGSEESIKQAKQLEMEAKDHAQQTQAALAEAQKVLMQKGQEGAKYMKDHADEAGSPGGPWGIGKKDPTPEYDAADKAYKKSLE
jgi:hypothetical protein